jgi:hypothetical protein
MLGRPVFPHTIMFRAALDDGGPGAGDGLPPVMRAPLSTEGFRGKAWIADIRTYDRHW